MANRISIDFADTVEKRNDDSADFNIDDEIKKIDAAFAEACSLLSDELWDECMSRGIRNINRGHQKLAFQKFRTPGINSKLIGYYDYDNRLGVIFTKSILKGEDSFHVMQAFKIPESMGQSSEIVYPFGFGRPSESVVAFLKAVCEDGLLENFR